MEQLGERKMLVEIWEKQINNTILAGCLAMEKQEFEERQHTYMFFSGKLSGFQSILMYDFSITTEQYNELAQKIEEGRSKLNFYFLK